MPQITARFANAKGHELLLHIDDQGYYLTDTHPDVNWDKVLFGEKSRVTPEDVDGYVAEILSHTQYKPADEADETARLYALSRQLVSERIEFAKRYARKKRSG